MSHDGGISSPSHLGAVAVPVHSPLQVAIAPQSIFASAAKTQSPLQVPVHVPPVQVPSHAPMVPLVSVFPSQVPSHVPLHVPLQVPWQFAATSADPSQVPLAEHVPMHVTLSSPGAQRTSTVPGWHIPETSQFASQLSCASALTVQCAGLTSSVIVPAAMSSVLIFALAASHRLVTSSSVGAVGAVIPAMRAHAPATLAFMEADKSTRAFDASTRASTFALKPAVQFPPPLPSGPSSPVAWLHPAPAIPAAIASTTGAAMTLIPLNRLLI
jgi:hypothetical protein